jgi:hypothetical protein
VAAALGFIVARVIKSASESGDSGNPPAGPAA